MPKTSEGNKKPPTAATNLIGKLLDLLNSQAQLANVISIAGGGAGMMEALACHPLGKF